MNDVGNVNVYIAENGHQFGRLTCIFAQNLNIKGNIIHAFQCILK